MRTEAQDGEVRARSAELLDNVADYAALHARRSPDAPALIEHNTSQVVTFRALDRAVEAFAAKLLASGFRKGDVLATASPLLKEHVYSSSPAIGSGWWWRPSICGSRPWS